MKIDEINHGIPEQYLSQRFYFCEKCGGLVEVHSNPERLYFCDCGKVGDYANCKSMAMGEYMYDIMKQIAGNHNGEVD
jgi:hypothetical protein